MPRNVVTPGVLEVEDKPLDGQNNDDSSGTEPQLGSGLEQDVDSLVSDDVSELADEAIGECFQNYLSTFFFNLDGNLSPIAGFMFPKLLEISPYLKSTGRNPCSIKYNLSDKINVDLARKLLVLSLGDYVKNLDFYDEVAIITDPKQLSEYVSEFGALINHINQDKNVRARIPVYAVAMNMPKKYRDLVVLSIKEDVVNTNNVFLEADNIGKDTFLHNMVPNLGKIVHTAEKYDVAKDRKFPIMPIIKSLNEASDRYMSTWNIK
ncbi:hypothetical protein HN385_02495 [archaeon]|jgi:hypothetical protein|nr:hypothetical protein [archaeon]MBT3450787.1 hypothetical protein [archaeon]MBT6868800.1 hypothetical protein [archaeon]MBT7192979.1 hypothetical protein [archaeon]MBT7380945.1 hypothetical protein [archaeon]